MTPMSTAIVSAEHSFPRVSGDEPWMCAEADGGYSFSPRERG